MCISTTCSCRIGRGKKKILTYPSSAGQVSSQGRNPRRRRDAEVRDWVLRSAPSRSRREACLELSVGEDEEQLCPRRRQRTSPRCPDFVVVSPSSSPVPASTPEEALPLAVRDAPESTPVAEASVDPEDSGPSWLQPEFELPTEEGVLQALVFEISS